MILDVPDSCKASTGSPDTPHPVVTVGNVSHYCGGLCQKEETDMGT